MAEFDEENRKTATILINKAKAMEHRQSRLLFFYAALLGVYGWQLSIPVLLGVAIGQFLDRIFPSSVFSWTLNFIFVGFVVGIFNANRWLHKEGTVQVIKKRYRQQLAEQRQRSKK